MGDDTGDDMTAREDLLAGIDPSIPSVARMYDYYLRGKDNFESDRRAAEKMISLVPNIREVARANRDFLGRAVRLVAESGIRQFIDIGAGLPTQQNVHQVARSVAPGSRVVYVDNDPIVLVHARALLADNRDTIVVQGDVNEPKAILDDPAVREHIDLSQPVAVLMLAILHFVPDDEKAAAIVARLRDGMVPGSYLIISHGYTGEIGGRTDQQVRALYNKTATGSIKPRDHAEIAGYFDGLDLLEPGVVPVDSWRPELDWQAGIDLTKPTILGGVARVP
ncbi:SAM-dependent methyltransferase [Planotetraspora sp. A-T 1434]|uniref:SAM-dependent methyltransferase n=1 Tax=Planotetraspora sp. A-T 1434 TaxID=2979219 RepID=UPI0021BF48AC|nr:SAM-dependent methyltransferase [Planotetraspora sp. A-T 1434]MCT9930126.1 SAM-dependent methyltransferase [Planotetraspora sp. A-T 1434]